MAQDERDNNKGTNASLTSLKYSCFKDPTYVAWYRWRGTLITTESALWLPITWRLFGQSVPLLSLLLLLSKIHYCDVIIKWNPLLWRCNECNGVSNHLRLHCLHNHLFRCRSKKISKLRVTGLCEGDPPMTGGFPSQRASYAENVSIWWRHHSHVFPICHGRSIGNTVASPYNTASHSFIGTILQSCHPSVMESQITGNLTVCSSTWSG